MDAKTLPLVLALAISGATLADEHLQAYAAVDQGPYSVNCDHLTFEQFQEQRSRSGTGVATNDRAARSEDNVNRAGN